MFFFGNVMFFFRLSACLIFRLLACKAKSAVSQVVRSFALPQCKIF